VALSRIDLKRFKALVSCRVEERGAETAASRPKAGVVPGLVSHKWHRSSIGAEGEGIVPAGCRKPEPNGNLGVCMTQKTVTRADLAEAVYGSVGLSRTESAELVERVLELISDALVTGANVKLSSFGSFQVRSKNERIGRNPKTGEEVPILPRQVLVFKPSNVLKSKINKSMVSAGK
jgi:integration host factor subunit alpha